MEIIETTSLEETYDFGRRFASQLKTGDCVALVGSLGAGKTALVRGIAIGLGLQDRRMVSSPTFVLVQEYPTQPKMYHIDLYRLCQPQDELSDLGIDEMLLDGVVLIEWADRAGEALPRPRWKVEIDTIGATERKITVERVE
jgi:tRNA threonylcarbamoyl adenosine modification protein YjeE